MSYNLEPLSLEELDKIAHKTPEKEYPDARNRLQIDQPTLEAMIAANNIVIPDDGPWHIANHPNRRNTAGIIDKIITSDSSMDPKRTKFWHEQGLLVDTLGRPLHPRLPEVLPTVGMYTGPGFFYTYGPQVMGNLGLRVMDNGEPHYAVVGVRRRKGVMWSLPGGFAESGESAEDAAFREGREEANIFKDHLRLATAAIKTVLSPLSVGMRDTAHAWQEEWFTFAGRGGFMDDFELRPNNPEEVLSARWMSIGEMQERPDFIGTHLRAILRNEGSE